MKSVLALCAALTALGGCQSIQERNAQRTAAQDTETCARLGAASGTDRDFQCKLTLEAQRRNAGAVNDAVSQQRSYDAGMRMIYGR